MPRKRRATRNNVSLAKYAVFIVLAVLISATATVLFYGLYVIQDIDVLEFDIHVTNHLGFNLDTDKIHFGSVMPGFETSRIIHLVPDRDHRVIIKMDGPDFVYPTENDFLIRKNEEASVTIMARPPFGTPEGAYEGTIYIISKRP